MAAEICRKLGEGQGLVGMVGVGSRREWRSREVVGKGRNWGSYKEER